MFPCHASPVSPRSNACRQGSSSFTDTTTYGGDEVTKTTTHLFALPTSATIEPVKDRLQLTAGYILMLTKEKETRTIPGTVNTQEWQVYSTFDRSGNPVDQSPTGSAAALL